MEYETQKSIILHHLKKGLSITSLEAFLHYTITRLSAVIYDLRKEGYDIQMTREYNEETGSTYGRYILIKEK